jgi:hypothetical protein
MNLHNDIARCHGHGTDAKGHQVRVECVNCARRLAPASRWPVPRISPPDDFPCPKHIRESVDE